MVPMFSVRLRRTTHFLAHVGRRFHRDRCGQVAAALSFTTILSLAPLLTVMFTSLALVPALRTWHVAIEDFIFTTFVPASGRQLQQYFSEFVAKAAALQTMGLILLGASVLMTMATIESTFNDIWHVPRRRSWLRRMWLYVLILILAPVAVGSGLVITSFLVSLPLLRENTQLLTVVPWFIHVLPLFVTWLSFVWCYKYIPNCRIRWCHAVVGSGLAAVVFELAKYGFGFYLVHFPMHLAIYGGFAAVPIFLLWIYLSWLVVLFGAEFTHGLVAFWPAKEGVNECPPQ
jgi:membrane protein